MSDKLIRLRQEILAKTAEYCRLMQSEQNDSFVPGETRINYAGRIFDEQEMTNLAEAGLEFWLTAGRYTAEFEQKLAEFLQIKYALLVNSGSSANLLAFMALTSHLLPPERRIMRGDEVITVACAFPTTVSPIVQFGAVPVFVDVAVNTANIDVEQLAMAVSGRTKAVMLAHTLGNPFNIMAVKEFCQKHQLWLIEDNCDALGSIYNGKYTGTWGDIGTSSFYPPHHITMGEGGAVYTDNPLLYKIMRSLRDWGRECSCPSGVDNVCGKRFSGQFGSLPTGYDHKYVYSHLGYNLKATDLQAAIGVAQLEKLAVFGRKRRENFQLLTRYLADLPDIQLPLAAENSDPAWFGFLITLTPAAKFSRNMLTVYLERHRIQTRNLFAGNLLRHPCFEGLKRNQDYRQIGDLPNTDYLMTRALWIGVYPGMTPEKLQYMADKIREFCLAERHGKEI